MFEISGLVAGYREVRVIDGIDLTLMPGELVAIMGRNGVGKTTLLKSIFGLCSVHSGEVRLDGHRLVAGSPSHAARRGMTLLPDDRGVFPSLSVEQNLILAQRNNYKPPVDVFELFPLLRARSSQLAGSLSGGEKQQVGIARAILAGSRLIAIDELSQGLQPSLAHVAMSGLRLVAESGVMVIVVDQSPELPMQYCDRIIGMLKGRLIVDAKASEIREEPEILTKLLVIN